MQSPIRAQEPTCTLNNNIAKQLIWRRNAPYFYQTLYTQQLDWPSLTVEWWVDQFLTSQQNSKDQKTLCYVTFGTHTSGSEKNYLKMAKVYLPNQQYIKKLYKQKTIKANQAIKKNDQPIEQMIIVQHEIQHDGQVNKIRHNPKKTNLIATRTPEGEVHIFDKVMFKTGRVKVDPKVILAGHDHEGYSLEWNPNKHGQIIAGSYDGALSLWDITTKSDNNKVHPLCYFNYHDKQIEDVSFNHFHDCIFTSCDDRGEVAMWDTRTYQQNIHHFKAENGVAYSCQFSPLNRHLLCTGGEEKTIKMWDIRNTSEPLLQVKDIHDQEITQLKWSNDERQILWATSGNNMTMWDLNEQKAKFVHSGHMQNIREMDLHPFEPRTVVSVDEENEIHVFQPSVNV